MNPSKEDQQLIQAAIEQAKKVHDPIWHSVAAAIRTKDGKIYTGVNVDSSTGSGGGACAEMSALSSAISAGDKANVETIVATRPDGEILPPCGVCRQMLITHAPNIKFIVSETEKVSIKDLLPYTYTKKDN